MLYSGRDVSTESTGVLMWRKPVCVYFSRGLHAVSVLWIASCIRDGVSVQLVILIYFRSCLLDITKSQTTHNDERNRTMSASEIFFSDTVIASVCFKTSNQPLISSDTFF